MDEEEEVAGRIHYHGKGSWPKRLAADEWDARISQYLPFAKGSDYKSIKKFVTNCLPKIETEGENGEQQVDMTRILFEVHFDWQERV